MLSHVANFKGDHWCVCFFPGAFSSEWLIYNKWDKYMKNLHALNNFLILLQLFLDSVLTYLDLLSFSISFPSVLIFDDSTIQPVSHSPVVYRKQKKQDWRSNL